MYAAAGCILGHNFPCYLNFRGGKGIAASVGMLLAVDWKVFLICAVLFLSIFAVTHYVSLASIVTYVAALIVFIAFGAMGFYGMDYAHTVEMDIVMAFLTVLAIYRHRTNISRLLKGNENKVYLKK
jgi:glycerol-3-phosphate acyltransferase PlsY